MHSHSSLQVECPKCSLKGYTFLVTPTFQLQLDQPPFNGMCAQATTSFFKVSALPGASTEASLLVSGVQFPPSNGPPFCSEIWGQKASFLSCWKQQYLEPACCKKVTPSCQDCQAINKITSPMI